MSQKHQVTNKWKNYERYYHYAPLKYFQKIVHKDKFIKPGESKVSQNTKQNLRPCCLPIIQVQ